MKNICGRRVVLVADPAPAWDTVTLATSTLEQAEKCYLEALSEAVRRTCFEVTIYSSPAEFLENIQTHGDDLILSIWSGSHSRSRKALVPSISEAYGLEYVGADPYTQVLCQDKYLSKIFASRMGFDSPSACLVITEADLGQVQNLTPPLVVKPNFEGGSIGIGKSNLTQSFDAAAAIATELLSIHREPILVEEFVPGKEVSLVLFGRREEVYLAEAIEIGLAEDPDGLANSLYGFELKKREPPAPILHTRITESIPDDTWQKARALFSSLDKVELLRIDGRLQGSRFFLIELSPDVHLGPDCTVAAAFSAKGLEYDAMIAHVLANSASLKVEFQNAMGK